MSSGGSGGPLHRRRDRASGGVVFALAPLQIDVEVHQPHRPAVHLGRQTLASEQPRQRGEVRGEREASVLWNYSMPYSKYPEDLAVVRGGSLVGPREPVISVSKGGFLVLHFLCQHCSVEKSGLPTRLFSRRKKVLVGPRTSGVRSEGCTTSEIPAGEPTQHIFC